MAGEWIKIEGVLPDKPEVFKISETLGIDPDAVVGKLVRFWVWCDQQTIDGNDIDISESFIDRLTHQPGFSAALRNVDWLQARSGSLVIPRFDRHNGHTAKARAESARRMTKTREQRKLQHNPNECCESVAEIAQPKAQPEKRREDIQNPPNPLRGDGGKTNHSKNIPTSPEAIAIAQLFNRKLTTPWSDREIKAFKKLHPIDPDDLAMVIAYTEAERAKGDEGRHRRDMSTFLNNFQCEVDRARQAKKFAAPVRPWPEGDRINSLAGIRIVK